MQNLQKTIKLLSNYSFLLINYNSPVIIPGYFLLKFSLYSNQKLSHAKLKPVVFHSFIFYIESISLKLKRGFMYKKIQILMMLSGIHASAFSMVAEHATDRTSFSFATQNLPISKATIDATIS